MKKIDCCSSSFRKLINSKSLYVDKTDFIFKLLESAGAYFFLSRPRRFGKSLTLSTFESVFEGDKELFKGLKIYERDYS